MKNNVNAFLFSKKPLLLLFAFLNFYPCTKPNVWFKSWQSSRSISVISWWTRCFSLRIPVRCVRPDQKCKKNILTKSSTFMKISMWQLCPCKKRKSEAQRSWSSSARCCCRTENPQFDLFTSKIEHIISFNFIFNLFITQTCNV